MHRVFRKIVIGLGNGERTVQNVKRLHGISDLRNFGERINAVNNSFHCTNIWLSQTKVGGERNHSLIRHIFLQKIVSACSREGISGLPCKSSERSSSVTAWSAP